MEITFDPLKRERTLALRGLDFVRAAEVFAGATVTLQDNRRDYQELRLITVGVLDHQMVILVWTPRDGGRRIISMRHANGREQCRYQHRFG